MRKLAAIMFTDIEGFTKLMQNNEGEAVQLLERHKQKYIQCTKQFKGQIVKYLGDGTLTIFSSAIEAVKCAVALQQELQKDPVIPVRIGIHQGDVMIENKDVIGDAVNLACRIQTQGIAGSVLVSEKVRDELQNHHEMPSVYIGSFNLKNIAYPVNLYAIDAAGLKIPGCITPLSQKNKTQTQKLLQQQGKTSLKMFNNPRVFLTALFFVIIAFSVAWFIKYSNSNQNTETLKTIAVLPFENINKDEQNSILADGLTEEMTNLLSSNIQLKIKKIPAAVLNKNRENLARLTREINAGSVLEGKVQHDKDSLFVFVNLRNTSTNEIIWSSTYREEFRNLMKVQEEVAYKIADALNTNLSKTNISSFVLDRTYNSDAYILYIQGRYAQKQRTPASMEAAIDFFKKALAEDSGFALAYSGISDTYTILIDNGLIAYDSGVNLARNALNHALALDSASAEIRASKAIFLSTLEGKHAEALHELKLSLSYSPNYASAHQWYALELTADGQFDSAISHIDKAIELEPFSERIWLNKALVLEFSRRYKDAFAVLNYLIARFPYNTQQFRELNADCHYWHGEKDSVLYYATTGNGPVDDYKFWEAVCSHNKIKLEKHLKDFPASELNNETLATYYVFLAQNTKALSVIEDAYNKKEFSWLKYLNVAPAWDPLRKEPRFKHILANLGFQ